MIVYSAANGVSGRIVRFSLHPFRKGVRSRYRIIARGTSELGYFASNLSRRGDCDVAYLTEEEALQWLIDGEDK